METLSKNLNRCSVILVLTAMLLSVSEPPAQAARRYFVRVVTDGTSVSFEGRKTSWEELPALLSKIAQRPETVLELAIASDQVTVATMMQLQEKGLLLAVEHDFEHAKYIGIQPFGSEGSPSEFRYSRMSHAANIGPRSLNTATEQARAARRLTPDRVAELEARVARAPNDLESRTKLIGYYDSQSYRQKGARKAGAAHLLWLIEHEPLDPLLQSAYCRIDPVPSPTEHQRGRELLLNHLERDPDNLSLLDSLAGYLVRADAKLAEELLARTIKLDPKNPGRHQKLAFQIGLRAKMMSSEKAAVAAWNRALDSYERAYELSAENMKHYLLNYISDAALAARRPSKARWYAEEALKNGNSGDHVFYGNTILGQLALDEDNIDAARKHLIASGRSTGSPVLGSFGPTMKLAKRMFDAGEKDAVIEFFRLCKVFWKSKKLDEWTADVKAGRTPKFGGQLR